LNRDKRSDGKSLLPHYKHSGPFSRLDIVLLVLLLLAASGAAAYVYADRPAGERAEIYIEGELVGSYPLDEERTIAYDCGITVHILSGAVAVAESDCPDQLCVHMGYISKAGERIICAPNKFVVVIRGKTEYDAVTGRSQT
jgi:hypothetical protein